MPEEPDVMLGYMDIYHAAAIVEAISTWAGFEHAIDSLIWSLARLEPEQGACLTAQFQGITSRMDALISLARVEHISEAHITELNRLRSDLNGPREKRNRLVHDQWFYGAESKRHYRLQVTARGRLDHTYKLVTHEELAGISEEFLALDERFHVIRSGVLSDFYASP